MKHYKMTEDRNNNFESLNNFNQDLNSSKFKKNEEFSFKETNNSDLINDKNSVTSNKNNINFLNDEDLSNSNPISINDKNKKFSFFEQNMKYKLKINIDYSDLDRQKAEISPKMLFKKRKLEAVDNSNCLNVLEDKASNLNSNLNQTSSTNNLKINSKLKNCFEKYLDFVHTSYFNSFENISLPITQNTVSNININPESVSNTIDETIDDFPKLISNFRFSSLDLLMNPLRQKFIFESWSPYEIALFECCICKYSKNFDMFNRIVK